MSHESFERLRACSHPKNMDLSHDPKVGMGFHLIGHFRSRVELIEEPLLPLSPRYSYRWMGVGFLLHLPMMQYRMES